MKSQYRYSFLHFSLFVGALILENGLIFFAFAIASGLVPRFKYRFGYYTFIAALAMVLAFFLNPNYQPLLKIFNQVLELRTISLSTLIAIVSTLTLGLLARASNELLFIIAPPKVKTVDDEEDFNEDFDEDFEDDEDFAKA
tara:strand:+ start:2149 stop:2571 length:423 start_codon:yes stop_codon:yes gene_type:complete